MEVSELHFEVPTRKKSFSYMEKNKCTSLSTKQCQGVHLDAGNSNVIQFSIGYFQTVLYSFIYYLFQCIRK